MAVIFNIPVLSHIMPRVAILTSGGLAPCLSAAIGGLIEKYNEASPNAKIIGYMHGYRGLLLGETVEFSKKVKKPMKCCMILGALQSEIVV